MTTQDQSNAWNAQAALEGVERMGRGAQATTVTGLACWEEMRRFSRDRVQQGAEPKGKAFECRTPGDLLQLQAAETRRLADAWVDGASRLSGIVQDAVDGAAEGRAPSRNQ